jgi:hypothetical protein
VLPEAGYLPLGYTQQVAQTDNLYPSFLDGAVKVSVADPELLRQFSQAVVGLLAAYSLVVHFSHL